MATGIGISVRNAKPCSKPSSAMKTEFARTPKYNIEGKDGTLAKK